MPLGDSWGLVHAEAMLGAVAQAEHRFADAARSLARAVRESQRLGFAGQAALHLTTLGRVEYRAGDVAGAADTLHRAIEAATANGDLRMVATAQVHLARALRASGQSAAATGLLRRTDEWFAVSGGGDGALLTRSLLAASVADVGLLVAVLDEARRVGDREAAVFAGDALARSAAERGDLAAARELLATADEAAAGVRHLVDVADRVDARVVRRLVDLPSAAEPA